MNDIEGSTKSFNELLSDKFEKKTITKTDLNKIFDMDFMEKWFLDANYSDEFEQLTSEKTDDLDNLIDQYVDKIFYNEEKIIWSERLLSSAYSPYSVIVAGYRVILQFSLAGTMAYSSCPSTIKSGA